ncbi:hypothetical protein L249_8072 [Ophiocordyceps polyrhachis-furcata BCC 54312]|uniref:Protein transport protein SEC23 n=1 Tax=Ophiocordyceps polyrhachis-furcata BCC 54312 TaxID=1330021 RepID=A0A367LHQ2_9HYPO|nr:hypothetical protein L249_8072 [Ophiocordyceps polyrhachis-furcata BCC 54312]
MDYETLKEQWSEGEDRDGVRLSWNVFPSSRMHYKDITASVVPPELHHMHTTIEYRLSRPAPAPPIFLYAVDLCQEEEGLASLKESLVMSLSLLPETALVGLITFGTMVQVHEIGYEGCAKSYVFRGSKDYSTKQVQDMLGLSSPVMRPGLQAQPGRHAPGGSASRFLLPVQQAEFQLTKALESLQKDPWPTANDRRSLRCTGVALSVAIGLMESSFQNSGGRIMLFAGGPATEGPGMVVGPELREPIRSHHDIDRENVKYYKKAVKFYDNLAKRTAHNGHIIDIFAGSLDQVGLLEMKGLCNSTGGHMILTDSFTSSMFKQSFIRVFEKDGDENLLMGFNAVLEVLTTKELKVTGLIGHAVSLNKKSVSVGETECGIGNTCSWKMCGIDPKASYGIYFEVASQGAAALQQTPQKGMIQFLTYYQHSSGQFHLRVTTIARNLSGPPGDLGIAQSFDQEAAAVLMSRIAVFKSEVDDGPDVLRWVDRMLIRLCSRFADYRKDDSSSFRLEKNFTLYPQFMFHLRRSQFLQVFNNSPDETAFDRHVLNHEDVSNSLVMIQPTLDSYTFDQDGGVPVLLDSASIQPTHILLLDTFFHILIFHGETIAEWRKAGYQDQEGYENFATLLEQPKEDARDLITDRFPLPRFIVCDAGGSQARFLLSKLNPSTTHTTGPYGGAGATSAQTIFTDDTSRSSFAIMASDGKLSPAKVLLLAAHLAGHADVEGLRKLSGLYSEALREDVLLRTLLTHLPETAMPQVYVNFLREIHTGQFTPRPDLELDDSFVSELPEKVATREAEKLRLLPLESTDIPPQCQNDQLSRFLILRAWRMDSEAGMLRHVPDLLIPFLDLDSALRTWILSTALPFFRRNVEYYAESAPTHSLCQFQLLPANEAVVYLLSRSTGTQSIHGHLCRDLRGLIGPWIFNEERWVEPGGELASGAHTQDSGTLKCAGWEKFLEWLVSQATYCSQVLCDALKHWGGPNDVEFGHGVSLNLSEPRQRYLVEGYARAVLASAYVMPEVSWDSLTGLYQVCCKLRSLLGHGQGDLPLPDVLCNLPDMSAAILAVSGGAEAANFLRRDLLQPSNPLTSGSGASTCFLMALLLSALVSSRLGILWTLKRAGDLAFLRDERDQKVELGKLMHAISGNAHQGDDDFWSRARHELLWLHDWGRPTDAASVGGVLGALTKDYIEGEFLKAMLSKSRYTLARSIYEEPTGGPLVASKVQDAVFQSALSAFDNASTADLTRGGLKKCDEILHALPGLVSSSLPASKRIQALLKATHALSGYRLVLRQGEPFSPVVLRVHSDPVSIIELALQQNDQAYTRLHEFLEMGNNIVDAELPTGASTDRARPPSSGEEEPFTVERRITAMCIEAALKEDDFETAYSYVVSRLARDAAKNQHDEWSWHAALSAGQYVRTERSQRPTHLGTSSGNPEVRHLVQRLECLAVALRIAPTCRLQEILKCFRRCEEQLHSAIREEAANEAAWDATADIPGTYESTTANSPYPPRNMTASATFQQSEEAPMSLFDLSKATAKIAQRNMPQLSSLPSIGIPALSGPQETTQRTRKRDQLREVATGTLVSGVGWLIGANPFMYSHSQYGDWRSPATVFDPKSVTRASLEPRPRKEKAHGPLISLNQHPDSHELPRQARPCQSLGSWVKKWIKWSRQLQLALRLLQFTGSAGILVLMILVTKIDTATVWVLRTAAGVSVLHSLYAVHHLAGSAVRRPPASSAAYQAFSASADIFILAVYAFGAFSTHRNGESWSTLLSNQRLMRFFVPAAYYSMIVSGCLHLVTLSISLWLCLVFRRISLMPPDMNPLEEHLTARPYKKINNNGSGRCSAGSVEDGWRFSAASDERLIDMSRPARIPFLSTRASSERTSTATTTEGGQRNVPPLMDAKAVMTKAHNGPYTKLPVDEVGWPPLSITGTEGGREFQAETWTWEQVAAEEDGRYELSSRHPDPLRSHATGGNRRGRRVVPKSYEMPRCAAPPHIMPMGGSRKASGNSYQTEMGSASLLDPARDTSRLR